MKKFNLSKKFSLITGAAGLLGKSHALALAEIGSSLILTDLKEIYKYHGEFDPGSG